MPKLPFGDKGPAEAVWAYGDSTEMIITPYLGKITLTMKDGISPVHEEGQGEAPVDAVPTGTLTEFSIPMARSTWDQLEAMLHAVRDSSILSLYNRVGCAMYEDAMPVVLKPYCDNGVDPDPSTWVLVLKATPYRDFDLGWDASGTQRVFMVKFMVFPSQESGEVGKILQFGV